MNNLLLSLSIPSMGLIIKNCVIVDDDVQITEFFSELLANNGLYILAIGHDGLDAIELFSKYRDRNWKYFQ